MALNVQILIVQIPRSFSDFWHHATQVLKTIYFWLVIFFAAFKH